MIDTPIAGTVATGPEPPVQKSATRTETPAGSRGAPEREPSPFGGRRGGRVRTALRVAAYVVLPAAAAGVAWFATRDENEAVAAGQHEHGTSAATETSAPVSLDAAAARRIGVTYATATLGSLAAEVRTVGEITYDETRVKAIAPRIEGWVDRLYVDFTGREVSEGEPLLSIYSPMLVTAQEELLLASRLARDVVNGTEEAKRTAEELVVSARRRLLHWDLPASDIERLERTGEVTNTSTLRSPARGVVVEKSVLAGQRIMEGETLFRVADLSTVWVEGEIFERDIAFVRLGAPVVVELQAYPGEPATGAVTYVYPTVDPATRTSRIRVALRNPALRFRPGMYATITLPGAHRANVVTVPRSAVLATGRRVVAFVRMEDGMLMPHELVTGLASDDRVEVLSGLKAGDVVVSSATFLVDAESNLAAALGSMANMPGMEMRPLNGTSAQKDAARTGEVPGNENRAGGRRSAPSGRTPGPRPPKHDHPPE
jgi:Cu(I)/Ag(I) efflux system membrane fusion protein